MKKFLTLLLSVFLVMALAVSVSYAQKIAYVNTDKVVKKSPQAAAIRKQLESEFKERQDTLVSKRKKLKKLEEKLSGDRSNMNASEIKNIEQDIRRRRRDLNNSSAEFREDVNLRRNEEINKLLRKISEVVISIGKREKIDMIMSAGVAYASKSIDISDKVLEQLGQEFNKNENK